MCLGILVPNPALSKGVLRMQSGFAQVLFLLPAPARLPGLFSCGNVSVAKLS